MKLKPGDRVYFLREDGLIDWFVEKFVRHGRPLTVYKSTEDGVTFNESTPSGAPIFISMRGLNRHEFHVNNTCPMEIKGE